MKMKWSWLDLITWPIYGRPWKIIRVLSAIITRLIKFAVLCVSDRSAHDAPPHSFFIIIKAAPCLHSIQVAAKVDWQEVAGDRPHCYTPLCYTFIRGQHSCWLLEKKNWPRQQRVCCSFVLSKRERYDNGIKGCTFRRRSREWVYYLIGGRGKERWIFNCNTCTERAVCWCGFPTL